MKVIVISGPTASGKTDAAIELAKKFGGEIVNFDSLLLYKEINIGTAKPSQIERATIPHHMIDVSSIANPLNASEYAKRAKPIVERLRAEHKTVYLVGGSGFYLQALLKGMYDSPSTPSEILERSEVLYNKDGIAPFLELLRKHDPHSFERYHENDHYRIRRAVEHWWSNGTAFSEVRFKKDQANKDLRKDTVHDWEILHIHLDMPKEEHLEIIRKRTEKMLASGLVDEVKSLLEKGFTGLEKPLQSIGYKETLGFLFGVYGTLEECKERIIISTRQLAKAQRTWFKREQNKSVFHPLRERKELFEKIEEFLVKN